MPKQVHQSLEPSGPRETLGPLNHISPSTEGEEHHLEVVLRPEYSAADYRRTAAIALRVFQRISMKWDLSEADQKAILGIKEDQPIETPGDQGLDSANLEPLERLSHVLGIYKSLHTLFSSDANADAWINKPNSARLFGGGTALQVMKGGVTGLRAVRAYLEAVVLGGLPPTGR